MYNKKILSMQNLKCFDFVGTKKNILNYFTYLEKLEWDWDKLNSHKGLITNYNFTVEYQNQPYSPIGKDEFNLSAKEINEAQYKKYMSSYHWATSKLSDKEQLYIREYFVNRKYEEELVDLLGFNGIGDYEFIKLKRSAIYKFADFLNLVAGK